METTQEQLDQKHMKELRDFFAAAVIQSLATQARSINSMVETAFDIADAMVAFRNKEVTK